MSDLMKAMAILRPGVDCADTDGTLKGIRWDTSGVRRPTQKEVDATLAQLANPPKPTMEELQAKLDALGKQIAALVPKSE